MSLKFVGLHAHTNGSLGDAIGRAEDHFNFVLENAGEDSMALAVSDHGLATEYGYVYAAKQKFKKKGVPFKPIWGCEMYIHPDLELWAKQKAEKEEEPEVEVSSIEIEGDSKDKAKWYNPINRRHHLVVLAQNPAGIKNLYKLISESYRSGFYRYPRADFKMLEKHKEGLIISSACLAGLPSWLILRDQEKAKEEIIKSLDTEFKPLLEIFGKDHAYLEIQFNKLPEQKLVNGILEEYSKLSGFKTVATADSHYSRPEHWREREIYRLLAQQSRGYDVGPDNLPKSVDELKCELFPRSGNQMFAAYQEHNPELNEQFVLDSITRTYDIAHDFIEDIDFDTSYKLPVSFLAGKDAFDELTQLCFEGMEAKDLNDNDEYIERLAKELKVIKSKGLSTYFLTLKRAIDVIKASFLVGAGRGSGASSLVNYVLGITLVDPIKNNLLFERFISENRNEPADVDSDIEDRDAALNVLRNEFGEHNVVAISNFNTLQLKSLVKDISKFYGIDFQEVNEVTRVMESEARQPILDSIGNDQKLYVFDLEGATEHSKTFQKFIKKYPHVAESIKILFKQNKSYGKHAGGVIITENSDECMPIIRVKGTSQTPWGEGLTAKHLEPFGLIKYDFLGIATLRTIRRCIERVLVAEGKEKNFKNVMEFYNKYLHPDVFGVGNPDVFKEIFHKGKFCGTFQFTEMNAQTFCRNVQVESIEDISAVTAIMRPGPLTGGADKKYLEAKQNKDQIYYEHEVLEEILGPTYGVLCYQEQFMLLANKLAGFTLTESDELRKLLMKPITSMADEIKVKRKEAEDRFINGCVNAGLTLERATKLWEKEILGFISYGFVKSHSISYSILSYQCAHLLNYHPDQWACAYLECDPDTNNAMKEVKALGYKVANIDILSSTSEWTIKEEEGCKVLYPPLSACKGVGDIAVAELLLRRSSWQESLSKDDSPRTAKEIFMSFFFDQETKQLKNGTVKTKNLWAFSKFNKRSLEMLCKTDSLQGFGFIGKGCLFENHAHFHRALFEHWADREKQSFDIEKYSLDAPKFDWTASDKIGFQLEILGTVPRDMILTQEEVDEIEGCGISNIRDLTDPDLSGAHDVRYWFVLTGAEQTISKNGRPYWKLQISNLEETNIHFNFFNNEPRDKFTKFSVYMAEMKTEGGWVNVAKRTFIEKLK